MKYLVISSNFSTRNCIRWRFPARLKNAKGQTLIDPSLVPYAFFLRFILLRWCPCLETRTSTAFDLHNPKCIIICIYDLLNIFTFINRSIDMMNTKSLNQRFILCCIHLELVEWKLDRPTTRNENNYCNSTE